MVLWQTSHDANGARSICNSGSGGDGSGVQLQVHGEEPQLVVARGRGHRGDGERSSASTVKTMHSNCDQQNLGRENHPEAETEPSGDVVWMLDSMP